RIDQHTIKACAVDGVTADLREVGIEDRDAVAGDAGNDRVRAIVMQADLVAGNNHNRRGLHVDAVLNDVVDQVARDAVRAGGSIQADAVARPAGNGVAADGDVAAVIVGNGAEGIEVGVFHQVVGDQHIVRGADVNTHAFGILRMVAVDGDVGV